MTSPRFLFVGCVHNESRVTVLGPFLDRELAEQECNVACDNAHLIGTRVGSNMQVCAPNVYAIELDENNEWVTTEPLICIAWRDAHNEQLASMYVYPKHGTGTYVELAFPEQGEGQ